MAATTPSRGHARGEDGSVNADVHVHDEERRPLAEADPAVEAGVALIGRSSAYERVEGV